MSPDDTHGLEHGQHRSSVTEMAVELTVAWLKRVESTADGRDPKEVVQALDEFFEAIHRNQQREAQYKERAAAIA